MNGKARKLQWRGKTNEYSSGENLFLGNILVGSYHYDGVYGKGYIGDIYNLPKPKKEIIDKEFDVVKKQVEEWVIKVINYLYGMV